MDSTFTQIRESLIQEALQSPALLSDLTGLEHYVAESYDARSFVELLQNADDAGASKFIVKRADHTLFVANNGRRFSKEDFEALCRSAASNKKRGNSIGYRGIGFKSVVGLAKQIYLISGILETAFSRELTQNELGTTDRVPLIRIPHVIPISVMNRLGPTIEALRDEGYTTIFAFDTLTGDSIENEFSSFDPTSLLFLRNIVSVSLQSDSNRRNFKAARTKQQDRTMVELSGHAGNHFWTVIEKEAASIAFLHDSDGPIRLDQSEAVAHAFLPTHETTGFPFKVNGDLSTDPSRTRVVRDARTSECTENVVALYLGLLTANLFDNSNSSLRDRMMTILTPFQVPKTSAFQRPTFATEFIAALKRNAQNSFEDVRFRPKWINGMDYDRMAHSFELRYLPAALDQVPGLYSMLAFLGAREAQDAELLPNLRTAKPSLQGAAEIAAYYSRQNAMGQLSKLPLDPDWEIWPCNGQLETLGSIVKAKQPLDAKFLEYVSEAKTSPMELRRLFAKLTDSDSAKLLIGGSLSSVSLDTTTLAGTNVKKLR